MKKPSTDSSSFNTTIVLLSLAIVFSGMTTILCEKKQQQEKDAITTRNIPISDENDNLKFGIPSNADYIINRKGYAVGYSSKYRQALWVSYCLTDFEATNNISKRIGRFSYDSKVKSATSADYVNSGYDRGHLAPAGDMAWDEEAMKESFLMSNISPQLHSFNGGIWKRLEEWCRGLAKRRGRIHIVTGPIFDGTKEKEIKIGRKHDLVVPRYFYKVIYDETPPGHMIGFIMPNEPNTNIYRFAKSVDEVEKMTNLDFFNEIPIEIQDRLEKQCDIDDWNR